MRESHACADPRSACGLLLLLLAWVGHVCIKGCGGARARAVGRIEGERRRHQVRAQAVRIQQLEAGMRDRTHYIYILLLLLFFFFIV